MTLEKFIFSVTLFAVCLLTTQLVLAQNLQRGLRNYQEIMSGKKTLEQLSSEEKREVITIYQRLKTQEYADSKSPNCRDALSRAESDASELADYSRRLRNCAEAQDYSDDCSSEFRRVKNAFYDYESAVLSIGSYCR